MKEKVFAEERAFPFKSLTPVVMVAVYSTERLSVLLGVNVDVVIAEESMELTVPSTEFPDESARVNVLVVMVEVSINSLKVAEMLETTVVAPSDGEVEETVGAVVSMVLSVVVVLSVLELLDVLLFLAHEITMRLKRRIERRMIRCFTWFPIGSLGEPNIYHDSGVFYKNRGC